MDKGIIIISSAQAFDIITKEKFVGSYKVREEFTFNNKNFDDYFIVENKMDISISFLTDDLRNNSIVFNDTKFTQDQLKYLSEILGFDIIDNPFFPFKKQGALINLNKDSKYMTKISLFLFRLVSKGLAVQL